MKRSFPLLFGTAGAIVALAVALNIVVTGVRLIRRAGGGLMDRALPPEEQAAIETVLAPYRKEGIGFETLRTRSSGRRSFVSVNVQVPGRWTVERGHELLERIERDIQTALPHVSVTTHLEPRAAEVPAKRSRRR